MMSIIICPDCKIRTKTEESRHHLGYGFATVKRVRRCLKCKYKIVTVELPIDIGNSVFLEDD